MVFPNKKEYPYMNTHMQILHKLACNLNNLTLRIDVNNENSIKFAQLRGVELVDNTSNKQ